MAQSPSAGKGRAQHHCTESSRVPGSQGPETSHKAPPRTPAFPGCRHWLRQHTEDAGTSVLISGFSCTSSVRTHQRQVRMHTRVRMLSVLRNAGWLVDSGAAQQLPAPLPVSQNLILPTPPGEACQSPAPGPCAGNCRIPPLSCLFRETRATLGLGLAGRVTASFRDLMSD